MNNLLNVNNSHGVAITLKELTDLIEVRHNDAMAKVEKLSLEPSFGLLRKIRISHIKGKEIDTYLLDRYQAVAVGAKLNNTLLMKVIDRIKELEQKNNKPLTIGDQIQLIAQGHVDIESRLSKIENNSRLTNQQEVALKDAKNQTVYRIADGNLDLANKLHRKVWSLFKKRFTIPRFNELPNGQFNDGLVYLRGLNFADMI